MSNSYEYVIKASHVRMNMYGVGGALVECEVTYRLKFKARRKLPAAQATVTNGEVMEVTGSNEGVAFSVLEALTVSTGLDGSLTEISSGNVTFDTEELMFKVEHQTVPAKIGDNSYSVTVTAGVGANVRTLEYKITSASNGEHLGLQSDSYIELKITVHPALEFAQKVAAAAVTWELLAGRLLIPALGRLSSGKWIWEGLELRLAVP